MVTKVKTSNKFERAMIWAKQLERLEIISLNKSAKVIEAKLANSQSFASHSDLVYNAKIALYDNQDLSGMMYSLEHIESILLENPEITLRGLAIKLAYMCDFPEWLILDSLVLLFKKLEGVFIYMDNKHYPLSSDMYLFRPDDFDMEHGYQDLTKKNLKKRYTI